MAKRPARRSANAKVLWLRALIACAYSFGFRKGELLNLRVRQVDLIDRRIELEEGTTKNDEGRKVCMTSEVFELMRECVRGKDADSFVFTREDGARAAPGLLTRGLNGMICVSGQGSGNTYRLSERTAKITASTSGLSCTIFAGRRFGT